MVNDESIIGVIYPIRTKNYTRLKSVQSPVFIKYLQHFNNKNPTKLKNGHYIIFYLSKKDKKVIGYSQIKNIVFKLPEEIIKEDANNMQMEINEFNEYIKNRESKKLLILELDKIIDIINPKIISSGITMTGKYIKKDEFDYIIK